MKIERLKLAKMLLQFKEIATDNGTLVLEGEVVEGVEVFIEKEGELVPAETGVYKNDGLIITITDGIITEVEEVEKEEVVVEVEQEEVVVEDPIEPTEDVEFLKNKITELEALLAERDARIAELEALMVEKDEQLKMSVVEPVHKVIKDIVLTNKENKALKYFK